MSDVVNAGAPLPPLDDDHSGIVLPGRSADVGHPIVCLQTDTTGLVFNVAGPAPGDVEEVARAIIDAQLRAAGGDDVRGLWVRDIEGDPLCLTPAGITRILGVTRSYASRVGPAAMPKRPPITLAEISGRG